MYKVKFCPKCANIVWNIDQKGTKETDEQLYNMIEKKIRAYHDNICTECGTPLLETTILIDDYYEIVGYDMMKPKKLRYIENKTEFYNVNKRIFKEYILPLQQFDTENETYQKNQKFIYGNYAPQSTTPFIPSQPNVPKCPICNSTNLTKLNVVNRSISFGVWGFGSNKVGKTYQCNNCKATF